MTTHASRTMLALTAIVGSLLVWGAARAAPLVHMATGGGTFEFAGQLHTIGFTAEVDEAGAVQGQAQFQLRNPDLRLHIQVDCLSVLGNEAWIGGVITRSSDPARVGTRVTWRVQDNGDGGGAIDQSSLPAPGVPGDCAQQSLLALVPWTNGNVQVR